MSRVLLDTDTLTCIMVDRFPDVTGIARHYIREFKYFTVSVVTISEIVEGLESIKRTDEAANFLRRAQGFKILPIGPKEAVLAGSILAELNRTGRRIGTMDPFVAATAIEAGKQLITNNPTQYQHIIDLGFPLQIGTWHQV